MGALPIKAQFTASRGSCKDAAGFVFIYLFLNRLGLDDKWHRMIVTAVSSGRKVLPILVSLNLTSDIMTLFPYIVSHKWGAFYH